MSHTGVRSTGSPRAARTRRGVVTMTGRVALDRGSGRVDSGAVEPLVPLWRSSRVAPQRASARTTARLVLENAGAATWRSRGADGLQLSYHWLDTHANTVVWGGAPHPSPQRA